MIENIDFLFVDTRPEFSDFFRPLLPELARHDLVCRIMSPNELDIIFNGSAHSHEAEILSNAKVVVTTNDDKWIRYFPKSRKVLLGHSIFIRDTIPSPVTLDNSSYADFDFYFCPSVYYLQWTIQALFDTFAYGGMSSKNLMPSSDKILIRGGYVKNDRQCNNDGVETSSTNKSKQILFVPSVFSPEHTGHIFHSHGSDIMAALAAQTSDTKITCRPHPTDKGRSYVAQMVNRFSNCKNVFFDFQPTPASSLYHDPNVLITDMSGFAFAFAFATRKRPIFFIEEKEALKHPRFMALARRFGRVASNHAELVRHVSKQLTYSDMLDDFEHAFLRKSLYEKFNTVKNTCDDLMAIHSGTELDHWTRLSLY